MKSTIERLEDGAIKFSITIPMGDIAKAQEKGNKIMSLKEFKELMSKL